jgi:phage terminase small subunit
MTDKTDLDPAAGSAGATNRPAASRSKAKPRAAAAPPDSIQPDPAASRPTRGASRHLRVVTDTEGQNTGQPKPKRTQGKVGQVKGGASRLTGLTDKQEAFAQAVAAGKNQSEAYRMAYDADRMAPATIWGEACRLLSHPQVAARLMVLNQEKESQRRMMAVSRAERVLQRLETLADTAATESVRVRANELLGKTAGPFTDQIEVPRDTERSVDQIQAAITERLRRLGLAG